MPRRFLNGMAVLTLTLAVLPPISAGEEENEAGASPSAERKGPDAVERERRRGAGSRRFGRRAPRESYLGVFSRPLPPSLAAQLENVLEPGEGVLIGEVAPGSPAAKAGLRQYDVVATWNGEMLTGTWQLHRQITAQRPGAEVELGIVRGAEREAVRVTLGARPAIGWRDPREIRFPEGAFPRRDRGPFGRELGPRFDRRFRPGPRGPRQSVSLTAIDDTQHRLQLSWVEEDGTPHHRDLTGTLDELRAKADELPEEIRDDALRALDRVGEERRRGPGFRFRIQPRVEAGQRRLRISVSRPGENGQSRIFELDHTFGAEELDGERLLQIDALSDELRQLAPTLREEVENVLRKVRIPRLRVPPPPEPETDDAGDAGETTRKPSLDSDVELGPASDSPPDR